MIRQSGSRSHRVSILALVAAAGSCAAQTQQGATWIGNGGNWFNGTNWDCQTGGGCIPDNDVTYTWWILINGGQGCFLDGSPTIDRIGMDVGTSLNQNNGTAFRIVGDTDGSGAYGTFSLVGATYLMNSTGNSTDLVVTGGSDATLFIGGDINNVGRIDMSDSIQNRMYGATGSETIHFTSGLEVWGSGQIGVNSATVVNEDCVFRATQPSPMILDPAPGGAWVNEHFVIAEGAGTIEVRAGTFDNNNGWLGANTAGARLLINGGTVFGGVVQSGSGLLQLDGGSVVGTTCLFGNINNGEGGGLVSASTSIEDMINYGVVSIANGVVGLHVQTEIRNYGLITLDSTGNSTDLILDNDVVLIQGGEVRMSASVQNRIYGNAGIRQLRNWDNWIHGSGQIGLNSVRLHNTGTIEADSPVATLKIDLGGDSSINQGVFAASNGARLIVSSDVIDQTSSGLIDALDGSTVELHNCTIIDGTLDSQGTGAVEVNGNNTRLVHVDNNGLVELPNSRSLRLVDSLHNTGEVRILSTGNAADLIIENDVTLSGSGRINLQGASLNNRVYGTGGVYTLTNVDNRVCGEGQFGLNSLNIVNTGVFSADAPGGLLRIDPTTTCVNSGLFEANTGSLELRTGSYDNSLGQIIARDASTVRLSGGTVDGGTIIAEAGGHLELAGGVVRVTAPTVAPGATGSVTANNSGCEDGLTNHGVISFENGVSGTRFGGVFHNPGQIVMNSTGNATDLALIKDLSLTGGGELLLNGNQQNRVYGSGDFYRLTNVDNTIRGEGKLGFGSMTLSNAGVIDADSPGQLLTVDLATDSSDNSGIMRASGGGVLVISGDTITQTGGAVEAAIGSIVEHNNCRIIGGSLEGAGEHRIAGNGSRLVDVANNATIELANSRSLRLQGTLANNGEVNLRSTGNATDLICEGPVVIDGPGEVVMHAGGNNRLYSGDEQTITIRTTVRGSGSVGFNSAPLINEGAIVADGLDQLTVDPSAAGLINRGLLHAAGPPALRVRSGGFTNESGGVVQIDEGVTLDRDSGTFEQTGGSTNADGLFLIRSGDFSQSGGTTMVAGEIDPSGTVSITGGLFEGDGVVRASVVNDGGSVRPGDTSGFRAIDDMSIEGDYTQSEAGSLDIVLINADDNSGLTVTGVATLAGELVIGAGNGFDPQIGATYELVIAGAVAGGFASIDASGMPLGKTVEVEYFATRAVATVVADGCLGDWNGDGTVNTIDFLAFLNDWSAGDPAADINGDGSVNTLDFLAFLNAWSAGCP